MNAVTPFASLSPVGDQALLTPTKSLGNAPQPRWRGWLPQYLWLWPEIGDDAVQQRMRDIVGHACATAMSPDADAAALAMLRALHQAGRRATELRLSARLLRGPAACPEPPQSRDLAACCLLLAAVGHNDALAAIEFAALAERYALLISEDPPDDAMPAGLQTAAQLARRMRRQARRVLGHRFSLPSADGIVRSLIRAATVDPLGKYLGYGPPTHLPSATMAQEPL